MYPANTLDNELSRNLPHLKVKQYKPAPKTTPIPLTEKIKDVIDATAIIGMFFIPSIVGWVI